MDRAKIKAILLANVKMSKSNKAQGKTQVKTRNGTNVHLPFLTAGDSGDPEAGQEAGHEEWDKRLGDCQEHLDQVTAEEAQDQAELGGNHAARAPRRHEHGEDTPRTPTMSTS